MYRSQDIYEKHTHLLSSPKREGLDQEGTVIRSTLGEPRKGDRE